MVTGLDVGWDDHINRWSALNLSWVLTPALPTDTGFPWVWVKNKGKLQSSQERGAIRHQQALVCLFLSRRLLSVVFLLAGLGKNWGFIPRGKC